jgi:hypothetical protein
MKPTDWVLNAVDFHMFGSIIDRAFEEDTKLWSHFATKSMTPCKELQNAVWNLRSFLYRKKPMEFQASDGTLTLSKVSLPNNLPFLHPTLDRIAADYLLSNHSKYFSDQFPSFESSVARRKSSPDKKELEDDDEEISWNHPWARHVLKVMEIYLNRTEIVSTTPEIKYYIYRKDDGYVITKLQKGTDTTPHAHLSSQAVSKIEELDQPTEIFSQFSLDPLFPSVSIKKRKEQLLKLLSAFETSKKNPPKTPQPIYYRPSWYSSPVDTIDTFGGLCKFIVQFKPMAMDTSLSVTDKRGNWRIQNEKTGFVVQFDLDDLDDNFPIKRNAIHQLFDYIPKSPLTSTATSEAEVTEDEMIVDPKGSVDPPLKLSVLDFRGNQSKLIEISPLFSPDRLRVIAEDITANYSPIIVRKVAKV